MSQAEGQDFFSQTLGGDDSELVKVYENVKRGGLFSAMSEREENSEMDNWKLVI